MVNDFVISYRDTYNITEIKSQKIEESKRVSSEEIKSISNEKVKDLSAQNERFKVQTADQGSETAFGKL